MASLRRLMTPTLALALVACGRSALFDLEGTSGAPGGTGVLIGTGGGDGGAMGTGGEGAGGTGGAGGAPVVVGCPVLVPVGGPIVVDAPSAAHHQVRPTLLPLGDAQVALLFAHEPVESPGVVPMDVVHARFSPWGAWPSSVGFGYTTAKLGGRVYEAAPTDWTGFGVLLQEGAGQTDPAYGGVVFAPLALAGASYDFTPPTIAVTTGVAGRAVVATRIVNGHVLGLETTTKGTTHLALSRSNPGGVQQTWADVGCGTEHLFAGAAAVGQGGLTAFTSGRAFGACGDDTGVIGPARQLHIARFTPGSALAAGETIHTSDPLRALHVTERSDGAWVVWQENGASAESMPHLMAVRVNAGGKLVGSPTAVNGSNVDGGPSAAARLGSGVAVAWIDMLDPSTSTIALQVLDATGAHAAAIGFSTESAWFDGGRIGLLGSPDGKSLLVAWSGASNAGEDVRRVRVARFDCVGED